MGVIFALSPLTWCGIWIFSAVCIFLKAEYYIFDLLIIRENNINIIFVLPDVMIKNFNGNT